MSASISFEQLLTTDDLARILRKSVHSIRHDVIRNPRSLPPRCALPGTGRNLWRPQDVESWLAAHVKVVDSGPPTSPPEAKPRKNLGGRPKKKEVIRQQQQAALLAQGKKERRQEMRS